MEQGRFHVVMTKDDRIALNLEFIDLHCNLGLVAQFHIGNDAAEFGLHFFIHFVFVSSRFLTNIMGVHRWQRGTLLTHLPEVIKTHVKHLCGMGQGPIEMKSTPVPAISRTVSRVTFPLASSLARPACQR